jgi:hypothetical protein
MRCGVGAGMISGMAVHMVLGVVLDHAALGEGSVAGSIAGGSWGWCVG